MDEKDVDEIISRYINRGYRVLEKTKPYRFTTVILEKDGKKRFLKIGVKSSPFFSDRPLEKMWAREEKFLDFVNSHLEKSSPKPPFRLVRFLERNQNSQVAWTLQEYIETPHIIDPETDPSPPPEKWLPTISQTLHWFDGQESRDWGPLDRDLEQETINKIEDWSKDPSERGILSEATTQKAISIIRQYAPDTTFRLQHGDFVPWHMHDDAFPKVVLVDIEAANLRFRYYDLAYIYHRIYTKKERPDLAKALLREFLGNVPDQAHFFQDFLPPLTNRAVGGLQDYCNEYPHRDRESNIKHLVLQTDFLNQVLKQDLDSLL